MLDSVSSDDVIIMSETTAEKMYIMAIPMRIIFVGVILRRIENDRITDTLFVDAVVMSASLDGRPVTTNVSLVANESRLDHVLHSDAIIMSYLLDSGNKNVQLNVNQKVDMFLKARVKYNDTIEFNEE